MDKKIPDEELIWKKIPDTNTWEMTHPMTHWRARMMVMGGGMCRVEFYRGGMFPLTLKAIGHVAALKRARQELRRDINRP
jgi:hypothetical protein